MIYQQNQMLRTLDDAMMRLFSPHQTEAERRSRLEQIEDEHIARKEKENDHDTQSAS